LWPFDNKDNLNGDDKVGRRRRESTVNIFLGNDSSLEGTMEFTGEARIDGTFKGAIKGEGRLWIGPSAKVEATIEATQVVISGDVHGDITASDRLEINVPGKLVGNISAPIVMMDEGVNFQGHCHMTGVSGDDSSPQVTLLTTGK
jgi:cytoskeletal protein CcmA (bactofilin family)